MDDPSVISAERVARLRESLLTKAEILTTAITIEPEDEDEHAANAALSETVYFLLQSFVDLR